MNRTGWPLVALLAAGACAGGGAGGARAKEAKEAQVSRRLQIVETFTGPIHVGDWRDAGRDHTAWVVRDDAAYDELLARLPARRVQMKQPAPPSDDPLRARPAIDFNREMLIVMVRRGTLVPATLARVEHAGDRLLVRYAAPTPPPEARPLEVGAYVAVRVARASGDPVLVPPRTITAEAELADAVGELVTLRGALSSTRIPAILGVDVEEGTGVAGEAAEATGWLEVETVTQAAVDAMLAERGMVAHRGPGVSYRLVAPGEAGLAAARKDWRVAADGGR